RRQILLVTMGLLTISSAVLVGATIVEMRVAILYAAMFVVGISRSFAGPALSALEAQVVPVSLIVKSATWFAAVWLLAAVGGPLVGGFAIAFLGPLPTYSIICGLYATAWFASFQVTPPPLVAPTKKESLWQSITQGVAYVFGDQAILGSMSLDLFAVLFGGVVALLPVFAKEILYVDAF